MAYGGFNKADWINQPEGEVSANLEGGWQPPTELWLPSQQINSVNYSRQPSGNPANNIKATPVGKGFNPSSDGRRYDSANIGFTGVSTCAWLIAVYRDDSVGGADRSIFREDGALTPLQEGVDGRPRLVIWPASGFRFEYYTGANVAPVNKVMIYAGRYSSTQSGMMFSTGSAPTAFAGSGNLGTGQGLLCLGSTEGGGEISTPYTILTAATWINRIPTDKQMQWFVDSIQNTYQLFKPNRKPFYRANQTKQVSPSLILNSSIFYTPTIQPATILVSPSLLVNSNTFYDANISAGVVALQPPLIANNQTFYQPTITAGGINVSPQLFTNTNTFFAASIQPGSVQVSPVLLTNTQTFYGPTLSVGDGSIYPNLFTNTNTFYNLTLSSGKVNLSPPLINNTQTFFAPTVTFKNILNAPLIANTNVFYNSEIKGINNISTVLLQNNQTFFAPSINVGKVDISAPLIVSTNQLFSPILTTGETIIVPNLFINNQIFYNASVLAGSVNINPTKFNNNQVFYSTTIQAGNINIAPSLFTNTQTFYDLELALGDNNIAPSLLINNNVFFDIQLNLSYTLELSLLTNNNIFYSPRMEGGTTYLEPELLINSNIIYNPSVTNILYALPKKGGVFNPVVPYRVIRKTETPTRRRDGIQSIKRRD